MHVAKWDSCTHDPFSHRASTDSRSRSHPPIIVVSLHFIELVTMEKKKGVSPLTASLSTKEPKKSRKRVRSSKEEQDAAEERRLTALLFGGGAANEGTQQLSESEESESEEQEDSHEISENFFELDRTGDGDLQVEAERSETRRIW